LIIDNGQLIIDNGQLTILSVASLCKRASSKHN